jgi:tetratricopeptide (TPR) repeat protein
MAPEVAGMAKWDTQLYPKMTGEFRKVFVALLGLPHPAGVPGIRDRQLYLALNCFDSHQFAETLRVVADFNGTAQPDDDVTHSMRRLWAFAALQTKQDLAACAAALENDLKSTSFTTHRAMSVGLLADLYRALGRSDEQEPLLKRELDHPAIVADTAGHASLTTRYQQLTASGLFATRVKAWIETLPLEWYKFAGPSGLDDPRLRDLDKVLKAPGTQFTPVEQVKLHLLVAQNTDRAFDVQTKAWNAALTQLFHSLPVFTQLDHFARSVVDDPGFDDDSRLSVLWSALIDSALHGRREEYAVWRKHPLVAKLDPRRQGQLESADRLVLLDRTSGKSIKQLAAALSAKEMGLLDVLILEEALQDLLRQGDLAAARELSDQVPSWNVAADVNKTKDALQLDFSKRIRAAESMASIHDALAGRVLQEFPNAPVDLPAAYDDLRRTEILPGTTPELTLQACLQRIKTRQFNREGFTFWRTFLRSLPVKPESGPLILDLVRIALTEAKDDDQRADVVSLIRSAVDLDNPSLRGPIEKMLAGYRQPAEAPLTYSRIRLYEISVALRLGQPVDLGAAFDGMTSPGLSREQTWTQLVHYTQTGDRAALKRVIDNTDSAQLLEPGLLHGTIPAFDLLGMKSEAETARRVARRELKNVMLFSWASLDEGAIRQTVQLAELVGDPEAVPPGWVHAICTRSWNDELRHTALMMDAWLHQNWSHVSQEIAELLKIRPTYYHYYWYQGMALHQLGQDKEAVGALTEYVRYSKDELEYPAAVALLQKLTSPPP